MRRRRPLLLAALLAPLCCAPETSRPSNLLLITVDTLRADQLMCYGGPSGLGRSICALAKTGTRFEWAFSAASSTAPSVASLLTSKYPSEHGVRQNATFFLSDEHLLVGEVLAAAGYDTAAIVSNPVIGASRNFGRGFRVYDESTNRSERNRPAKFERDAAHTADAAIAWVQADARPPWFLWVHFQDPHGPYEPPNAPPERDAPGDEKLPLLHQQIGLRGIPHYQQLPGLFSAAAYERRYRAEVRYLDAHVARLIERIEAFGGPVHVLFTADHGESFQEDAIYFSHGHSLGLEQIRVPLLLRPAGGGAASVVATSVSTIDVAPTLLTLAGVRVPAEFRGRPLPSPHSPTPSASSTRAIFAEQADQVATVVGDRYYSRQRNHSPVALHYGRLLGLPRVATLRRDGSASAYSRAGESDQGAADALDAILAELQPVEGSKHRGVSAELLERMRALGYVEP